MSAEPLPPLADGQVEVMNVVWDRGEATVAEVWAELAGRRPLARNTVLTTMTRLVERGWLLCDPATHAHRYRPAVPREAGLGAMVQRLVDTAFGGSAEGLVLALLHDRRISEQEAERLRALIDAAEREAKP